jgi:S1-C subfamily serine protease
LIQTDCRLQLGYSGGALLNLRGEMIGLTTCLASLEGEDAAAGFAIPVDELFQRALESLKAGRKVDYGFLGLAPESLPLAHRQEGRTGVRVAQIVPGTPAARSDLKLDDIVKEVAGVAVTEPADMIRELSKLPADAQVVLSVERARGKQTVTLPITVQLAKKYIQGPPSPYGQAADPPWRGLTLDHVTATAQFASRISTNPEVVAVAVVAVEVDSPAWRAGLRPGDWISHIAEQRVGSPADFARIVARLTGPVTLRKSGGPEDQRSKVIEER